MAALLWDAAPAAMRDPKRAVDHFRFAARGGYPLGLLGLARAYETGVGVERDLVRAVGYLLLLQAPDKSKGAADLARLSSGLSSGELGRARSFRLADNPVTPSLLKEYQVASPAPGLFNRVNSSFRPVPDVARRSSQNIP